MANKGEKRGPQMNNLRGEEGLITAVIFQATKDLETRAHRDSALEYFRSDLYRNHVTWLGLPPDIRPMQFERFISRDKNDAGSNEG